MTVNHSFPDCFHEKNILQFFFKTNCMEWSLQIEKRQEENITEIETVKSVRAKNFLMSGFSICWCTTTVKSWHLGSYLSMAIDVLKKILRFFGPCSVIYEPTFILVSVTAEITQQASRSRKESFFSFHSVGSSKRTQMSLGASES